MTDIITSSPTNITQIPQIIQSLAEDPNLPSNISPLDIDILKNPVNLPALDYTNLDFSSIKLQLLNLINANAKNFGYTVRDFSDSNTAGMFLNVMAYMGQMMSYHTDSMVNELFLDTAQTPWAVSKLVSMFGYKPKRPQPGMVFLAVTRRPSTNFDPTIRQSEDSSEIIFSQFSNRKTFTVNSETFEIFPTKEENGTLVPDLLGDFILPPYNFYGDQTDPDYQFLEMQQNTYYCFGLTGTTKIDNFISQGTPNQVITLSSNPVSVDPIIVQVEDLSAPQIAGSTAYNTWNEITYLSLSGFRSATSIKTSNDNVTPYLVSSFKLSSNLYTNKLNGTLQVGTVLELDYNNILNVANYQDFKSLTVPYQTCILISLTSSKYTDPEYVDVLLYHPSYVYGQDPNTLSSSSLTPSFFINYVYNVDGTPIYWQPGDILYLLNYLDLGQMNINSNNIEVYQPQIVSDTQLALAASYYPDIQFLNNNPLQKIAIGKAISSTTLAFGLSADIQTYIESDNIFEITADGNFQASVRFGDGIFGAIPANNASIKIIYRTVDSATQPGSILNIGDANQIVSVGTVDIFVRNDYASAPAVPGEDINISKFLAPKFISSQDRAVSGSDYTLLAKKYNSNLKISTVLAKADSDSSIVRLYALIKRTANSTSTLDPLTLLEKLSLRDYLNAYKCMGVTIEVADGAIRPIDLRVDVRIKSGYLTGQVKNDITTVITSFFSTDTIEMGIGFRSMDLINALSAVQGISTIDLYFLSFPIVQNSDGSTTTLGVSQYQQIRDIPSYYTVQSDQFPVISSQLDYISSITQPMNPYEILYLNSITINTVSA